MNGSTFLVFIFVAQVATAVSFANGVVDVVFSGRNLPSMDPFNGAPDAFLNVYFAASLTAPFVHVGRTDDFSDNRNPDWPDVFSLNYTFNGPQRLKVDMYDADWPDSDDYMGFGEISLAELVNSFGGIVERDLIGGNPGGGQLLIKLK